MVSALRTLPAIALLICLSACKSEKPSAENDGTKQSYSPYHEIPDAEYVGGESCKSCHEDQFGNWMKSDHHLAMNPATKEFVLGDFNDVEFDHFGQKFFFHRKGDEYWVKAPDSEGAVKDMKIDFTFGHYPLQQYLIAFPGGRYQALQVCWDSRPKEEGGQRWYHLYPDEPVPPTDVLHWTRRHFNWNYMCADCHSTNLAKNFDPDTLTYHTTWTDMSVNCEACHGPGSEHVKWAEAEQKKADGDAPDADYGELKGYLESKGLVVTLKEPEEAGWTINPDTHLPMRTKPLASNVQVETCARCHAHRTLNEPAFTAGQPFFDTHTPSIITDQLYNHDGQIDEEVYVYGSFVQSKMYHAGVRCTDCHNPHTMKVKLPGNALCLQCHQPDKNTPAHHFHPMDSTGASCVECHMPTKNFMVVDARRDHSMRIPRPDIAKTIGAPDACTNCHTDQTQDWAAEHFKEWWGSGPRNVHYGEILFSARTGEPGSLDKLIALAGDMDRPGIVRAAAVETLGQQSMEPTATTVIQSRLSDPDPAVRVQAITALQPYPPDQRLSMAGGSLEDPVRSVRIEAARILAAATNLMTADQKTAFDKASQEFIQKQMAISDRAGGYMGLALYYSDLGQTDKAIEAYRMAKKVEPEFVPSRINLAELLFSLNRPKEAEQEFRDAIDAAMIDGEEGLAHDALARFLIRMKRYDEGLVELKRATELMPDHAQTRYFYGVALNSLGEPDQGIAELEVAHKLDPYNVEYLVGLATVCRDEGQIELARKYTSEALRIQPENQQLQQLLQSLGG